MAWFEKKILGGGFVYFPGNMPPRPGDFKYIVESGVQILQRTNAAEAHWGIEVEHATRSGFCSASPANSRNLSCR